MLCKVVVTFKFADEILKVAIKMKAIEQCFPLALFNMLHKLVVTC